MITTDQLHRDLSQLRDALEAFAFTFNSVVIQKGHIVLPTAEVTGVDEKALQDLEDALNATDGMRVGMSSYLVTGDPRDLLDGLQAADSEN